MFDLQTDYHSVDVEIPDKKYEKLLELANLNDMSVPELIDFIITEFLLENKVIADDRP